MGLAIGGVLASSWLAAAPIDDLRDCAQKVSADKTGLTVLSAACPQLEGTLRALGLTPILYDGWQERLNDDALKDLAALVSRYGESERGPAPDIAALPGILKSLASEQPAPARSWMNAVKAWLKTWLAKHPDALTWLDRWVDRIGQSATLLHVIYYSLIAIVLLAAAAVIVNELRAAGLLGSGRRRAPAPPDRGRPGVDPQESGDLEPTALADQLAVLLRSLVLRLMQSRRLGAERSLTHRELVARSAFDTDSQRAAFASVAGAAESIMYGPRAAIPEQLDRVLSEGRGLLAQISDLPSAH